MSGLPHGYQSARGKATRNDARAGSTLYTIIPEIPDDHWEVEALYDTCFAPGRTALSSYRLRMDVPPVLGLSQVVRDSDGILAGAIRYWPVRIGAAVALLLGPVAVHPTRQSEGLGRALIEESLAQAGPLGWDRVMLVGDAPYYGKFGFTQLQHVVMPPPTNPDRVLGRAITPGAWNDVSGDVRHWND